MIKDIGAEIPLLLLLFIMGGILCKGICSKDFSKVFCPLMFIVVYLAYYVVIPFFFSDGDIYGKGNEGSVPYLMWGAFISLISILLGFQYSIRRNFFKRLNLLYRKENIFFIGITLFIVGLGSYILMKGFAFKVIAVQDEMFVSGDNIFNHGDTYITNFVSLLPASAILIFASNKKKWISWVVIFFAILIALMGGGRWRFVTIIVPFFCFIHLYPNPRRINYIRWIPLAVIVIYAMGIIEKTRNYGSGLDLEALQQMDQKVLSEGAKENELVYYFSAGVMEKYEYEEPLYFESIITALTMPLPRSVFPWKPDAQYLRDANLRVLGTLDHGAAYLNFVEGYLSFGWLGIVFNGFSIGFLSRIFWDNYRRNRKSIGAILFLSLYNSVLYMFISRGYLAQELVVFIYFIPVVYWVSRLSLKFFGNSKFN